MSECECVLTVELCEDNEPVDSFDFCDNITNGGDCGGGGGGREREERREGRKEEKKEERRLATEEDEVGEVLEMEVFWQIGLSW